MPDEVWIKFKWTYFANLSNAGSGASSILQVFRGNSLFDPDQTGVGSQPLTFDQWCPALYTWYYVAASKIKVDLWSTSNSQAGMLFTVLPSADVYSSVSVINSPISQQPYAITKPLLYYTQQGARQKIKAYMTTNKIYGLRATEVDGSYTSAYNASPSSQWYWNVCLQDITGANNVCQANGIITLTYYAKLWRRAAITAS